MIAVLASTLVQIMVSMKFHVMSGDVRSTERITFNRAMETTVTLFVFCQQLLLLLKISNCRLPIHSQSAERKNTRKGKLLCFVQL